MEQVVRVRRTYENGTASVVHERQSACSGDCHKCSGCGATMETISLIVANPIGAVKGDLVTIESESGPVLRAAAVLYVIPVALFFLGYVLGAFAWEMGALSGCLFFALGICLAVVYDRRIVRKEKTGYTITGFAEDSSVRFQEKGDN